MTRFLLISSLLASHATAHHGRDFLLVLDANVPSAGDWVSYSQFDFSSGDGPDESTVEIGASTGLFPHTSLNTTLAYADLDGRSWTWSAASASLQFDLTPADSPIMIGFLAGRDFALDRDADTAHEDHEEEAHHSEEGGEHGEDSHDHGEATHHEHTGLHQHGIDACHARFIVEAALPGGARLIGNLIGLFPDHGDTATGYALGFRQPVNAHLSLGAEITGGFPFDDYQEAALGIYYTPDHALSMKLGIGAGLNSRSPDFTVHTGVVWKF